jgi:hypothetical protein
MKMRQEWKRLLGCGLVGIFILALLASAEPGWAAPDTQKKQTDKKASDEAAPAKAQALPNIEEDPAFDTYVDLDDLAEAWENLDAKALTDIGLQLAEGERVLLRSHKSITAAQVLSLAARVASQTRDKETLQRLVRAAETQKRDELAVQFRAALKLASASRAFEPALTVQLDQVDMGNLAALKAVLDQITAARLGGNTALLELIAKSAHELEGLSEAQKKLVLKAATEAQKAGKDGQVSGDVADALAKLSGLSRGKKGGAKKGGAKKPKGKKKATAKKKPKGKKKATAKKKPKGKKKPTAKKMGKKKPTAKKTGKKKPTAKKRPKGNKKPTAKKSGKKRPTAKKTGPKKPGAKKPGGKKPGGKAVATNKRPGNRPNINRPGNRPNINNTNVTNNRPGGRPNINNTNVTNNRPGRIGGPGGPGGAGGAGGAAFAGSSGGGSAGDPGGSGGGDGSADGDDSDDSGDDGDDGDDDDDSLSPGENLTPSGRGLTAGEGGAVLPGGIEINQGDTIIKIGDAFVGANNADFDGLVLAARRAGVLTIIVRPANGGSPVTFPLTAVDDDDDGDDDDSDDDADDSDDEDEDEG